MIWFTKPTIKIAACYCVYDDYEFLEQSINSIINHVDEIYFFIPFGEESEDNEKVLDIVGKVKCKVFRKEWSNDYRNIALDIVEDAGFQYCLMIDPNNIWDKKSLDNLIKFQKLNKSIEVFTTRFYNYYKKSCYRINPIQSLKAISLIKTNIRFNGDKVKDKHGTYNISLWDVCWHDVSFLRSDEKIRAVINDEEWYEKYWLNWTTEMINFHPVFGEEFHSVVEVKGIFDS